MQNETRQLTFDECLLVMQAMVGQRPSRDDFAIGITTTQGRSMTIRPRQVSDTFSEDVRLSLITNQETLSALLSGTLDPNGLSDEQLLIWGGDINQWSTLVDTVSATSGIGARLWARK
jgi:hypothetical protein